MKTFILLSAVPGCGKSTWAEEYRLTHNNVFIVSSDTLRKEIVGALGKNDKEDIIWDRFRSDILKYRDYSSDVTVIADATNITNGHRLSFGKGAIGFDKYVLVIFKRSHEKVLEGNKARSVERFVPIEAIEGMESRWEEVNEEVKEFYDEIIVVDKYFEAPHVKEDFHYD